MGTAVENSMPTRPGFKPSFEFLTSGHSDAQGWASECPDVKNYKWRLNPVWHRMLHSCTRMATVGIKGLISRAVAILHCDAHVVLNIQCIHGVQKYSMLRPSLQGGAKLRHVLHDLPPNELDVIKRDRSFNHVSLPNSVRLRDCNCL